jgi:hypothetical protein
MPREVQAPRSTEVATQHRRERLPITAAEVAGALPSQALLVERTRSWTEPELFA